jgi:hypothetical protein
MERPPQRLHGPASRATEPVKQYVRRQLQAQPDLTLVSTDIRNVPFLMTLEMSLCRGTSLLSEKG